MTAAPVGFQCPACVAEGKKIAATGSGLNGIAGSGAVTKSIIGINAVIFAIEFLVGVSIVAEQWGMLPVAISQGGEWWRLFTAAFLHASLLHIGFNMYVLWVLGPVLETALGHVRFLVLYLMAALGGSAASYTFSPLTTVSVGASGAIFGLMAALLVVGYHRRMNVTQIWVLLGINIVIGFVAAGIDWRAHLGGALVGAAVAAIMIYSPRQGRMLWQTLGTLAVLGLLITVVTARTLQIQQALLVPFS